MRSFPFKKHQKHASPLISIRSVYSVSSGSVSLSCPLNAFSNFICNFVQKPRGGENNIDKTSTLFKVPVCYSFIPVYIYLY